MRGELALGVTDMCVASPLSQEVEPIAGDLIITLADKAELPIRITMAEKLAECEWAPNSAVRHLAFDQIEVASIVIRKSARLTDDDLTAVAREGSPEHRFHIAGRPNIAFIVTEALAEPGEPPVLRALANNDTAQISDATIEVCLTVARDNPKLREALARRHDLSTDHATQLCLMLPEHWREELTRRFGLDKHQVEKLAIDRALGSVDDSADADAARRVQDMAEAKKLNGQVALQKLKEGDELFFDHAVASLCGLKVGQWRVALAMSGVRAAAMACHGSGLDRTAYPVVHRALQRSGRLHQVLEGEAMAAAANIFRMYGDEKARKALRQMGAKA